MERRKFTREFKLEAVRPIKERYTFSDAVTLMEYTLDTAIRAQRKVMDA